VAGCDEYLRGPVWQEQAADGLDDDAVSMNVPADVLVPYVVEQDEDGAWCAYAPVRPGVAAFGDGLTRQDALDDLKVGLAALLGVVGPQP
jgi:hypothetical protein